MKICELHLMAFGPFASRTLDLCDGNHGLHVIFGPNEAGKSSTLRALEALLYGFPHQTPDDFLHPSQQLRVGGKLRHSDGTEIDVVRKKGRKRTLLAPDDTPLPDDTLARFLVGVSQDLFRSLFGIDHDALIRGGNELLAQKGEIGQALFSAGVAAGRLRKVLSGLEAEAEELFKPRGSNPLINRTLSELDRTRRAMRDASLPARKWEELRRDLDEVDTQLRRVESARAKDTSERKRLLALQRALPRLAERRRLQRRLDEFQSIIELPTDFEKRRLDAARRLESAAELHARAERRIAELEKELEDLQGPAPLLEQAVRFDLLREELGSHKKAAADRPRIVRERDRHLDDARLALLRIRSDLDLEDVERLRPAYEKRTRLIQLAEEDRRLADLEQLEEDALLKCRESLHRLERQKEASPAPPDDAELQAAVQAASRVRHLDEDLAEAENDASALRSRVEVELSRATLGPKDLEALERLPVPSLETLRRCEADWRECTSRCDALEERGSELEREAATIRQRLDRLEAGGSVPSESILFEARQRRDGTWRTLAESLLEGRAAEADRVRGYEEEVRSTDDLADRLRREARLVHELAELQAEQRRIEEGRLQAREALESARAGLEEWQAQWGESWRDAGIEPLTPPEMMSWWEWRSALLEKGERLRAAEERAGLLSKRRDDHLQRVSSLLGEPASDGSLSEWVARGERRIAENERARREREEVTRQLEERRDEERVHGESLARRQKDRTEWTERWRALLRQAELPEETSPEAASTLLDDLTALFERVTFANNEARRIKGIDHDAERFEAKVQDFAREVAPELAELPATVIFVRLDNELAELRRRATRREEVEGHLRERREELRSAEAEVASMQNRLEALRSEARCGDEDDLEEIERASAEKRGLRDSLEQLEKQLIESSEGAELEELEREAASRSPAELEERLTELTRNLEEHESTRKDLYTRRGTLQGELERMDGSARSAELAESLQSHVATLDDAVVRYARVRLAARLLEREIERYRQENQAPLLSRASELFVRLTMSSFSRLVEDVDDKDQPVLIGVREDGERVPVSGMSEGTRDQLYLALRLATLEQHLERIEPIPFIVDDILINFDDRRSRVTLEVLAELSGRTQVILFTHHRRVLETARDLSADADVWLHALSGEDLGVTLPDPFGD
ncbi:MAG: AAA family ATPase [Planctomycetota bacterium]